MTPGSRSLADVRICARVCARARDKLRPYINNDGQIKHTFARQLVAEFLGTMLFQIFGGAAPPSGALAAPANGFALVAISERRSAAHAAVVQAPV